MFRFRHLAALILVAALAASLDSVGARVVHPIVCPPTAAAAPAPAPASDGRRLFATAGRDELIALCQQVAHAYSSVGATLLDYCLHILHAHVNLDALQDAVHHDGDAARRVDAGAAAGHFPADHGSEGGEGGDEAGRGVEVGRRREGRGDGVVAAVVQGELHVPGGLAEQLAGHPEERRQQRGPHDGALGGGDLLHRLPGHLRGAAGAAVAHTRGAAPHQSPRQQLPRPGIHHQGAALGI